jgi:hypothetical protein
VLTVDDVLLTIDDEDDNVDEEDEVDEEDVATEVSTCIQGRGSQTYLKAS